MRRALGLDPEAPPQPATAPQARLPGAKRRFVADGAVPVTLIHGRRDDAANGAPSRLEAAEAALRAEREARLRAERAAAELQTSVHDLRTRLGHAELAMQEALAAKAATEQKLAGVEAALGAESEGRVAAERELAIAVAAAAAARERRSATRRRPFLEEEGTGEASVAPRVAAARKPSVAKDEPKPVKWWLTAKKKARRRP